MNVQACQRWRDRRDSYRPAGETISTTAYEVAPIAEDRVARAFVEGHHYSASYPAARFRFGLYRAGALVGVAVFSHPCNDAVLSCLPGERLERTELGRFVLLDDVPANGETWMLARCFEMLRRDEGIVGVVSFSDPCPRTTLAGQMVFPGHVGTIYQALNGVYLGRARKDTLRLLPDGSVLHNRALAKLRAGVKGWRYVLERMQAAVAAVAPGEPDGWTGDAEAFIGKWLPRIARPLRHGGNHKYVWALDKHARKQLPKAAGPYPKMRLETLFGNAATIA